jgi:hypothetical protein
VLYLRIVLLLSRPLLFIFALTVKYNHFMISCEYIYPFRLITRKYRKHNLIDQLTNWKIFSFCWSYTK